MNDKTSKLYFVTIPLAVLVLGSGCASQRYRVHVDAVRSEHLDQEAVSYRLVNANPERDTDDLRVQQVRFDLARVAVLYAPDPRVEPTLKELRVAAGTLGIRLQTLEEDFTPVSWFDPRRLMVRVGFEF